MLIIFFKKINQFVFLKASLGSDMVSPGRTTLFIQYNNGSHIPLCHLTPGICEQQTLDTAFRGESHSHRL
ncbi:790_t:CDS:2 [Entrophospora sp. SA101]|nr:8049_t:CDS:2 [Entrophospora sp. SA101]CAJ0854441.1 790_t:CDS:2 [Entrophospora sp. SA101]